MCLAFHSYAVDKIHAQMVQALISLAAPYLIVKG